MQAYWMWFAMLQGVTLQQKLLLLEHFSTPEDIYSAADYSHIENLLPQTVAALSDKDMTPAKMRLRECARKDISVLTFGEAAYPARLRNIPDPPLILYYRGVLPDFDGCPAIGVVGTRKATAYGTNTTREIAAQIARCGGLVVSGGAKGIDTAALEGALAEQLPSVTVLGCGVDIAYPAVNRQLFNKVQRYGCLISEYPPGTKPAQWQFPARNRIISGMSNGVLVVEAPERSGALITARDAMEQGRDVFVIPGNIDLETFVGSNKLLQDGAAAVFSGWDVMKEYAQDYPDKVVKATVDLPPMTQSAPRVKQPVDKKAVDIPAPSAYSGKENNAVDLTEEERLFLQRLGTGPRSVDDVIAEQGLTPGTAGRIITKLTLKGLVINHPGKQISAKKQ